MSAPATEREREVREQFAPPHRLPRIIGLSGYARSGKDTTGLLLQEKYGYTPVSFAASLKNLLYLTNPPLREGGYSTRPLQDAVDRYGWDEVKQDFPSSREMLQRLGVACRKMFGEDVWVRTAFSGLTPGQRYVFTDVRFPNEAQAIRSVGGEVWRVIRPNTGPVNGHVSETALDTDCPERIIHNHGTVEDLRRIL